MNVIKFLKNLFFTEIKIGTLILPMNLLDLLLKLILPILLLLIAYKIINKGFKKSIYKTKLTDEKKESVFKWIKFSFRVIIVIIISLLVVDILGAQITQYLSAFANFLTKPFIQGISITTILLVLPILYLAQLSGKLSQKFISQSLQTYFKLNPGTQQTITAVVKNVTVAIVILLGLTIIGIDLTLLLGLFGVIGIGIGFGLQSVVGNLFAGLVILTTKPVKIGDHILVDGTEGKIVEIRFLQSIVSTITHESIIIPNSKLIDNPVHNYSFDDKSIIIRNSVQVSYATDLDLALQILESVSEKCSYRLKSQKILTRVVSFDDSGITLAVVTWIKDSNLKYDAMSYINLEIWRAFKENKIEIPFPQLDLSIKKKS